MEGSESSGASAALDDVVEVGSGRGGREAGRTIIRRVLIYMPSSIVPAVLALVTSMIFTRVFTPAEFGMFSMAAIVVATPVKVLSTAWLLASVGKFLPPQHTTTGRKNTLDGIALSIGFIVFAQCLVGTVAILVGRAVLSTEWHDFLVPACFFVVAISLFEILSTVLAAEAKASEYTAAKLVDSTVTLALRLLFVSSLFSMNVTLMLVSVAISNGILVPLMWRRGELPRPSRLFRIARSAETRTTVRSFVGFGFPMTLWLFSSILLDVGDRWVVKLLLGSGAVGIYDANYRLIAGVAALLVVPVTITIAPYVMGLSVADEAHIGRTIGTVIDNLSIVAMLAVGLTVLFNADLALVLLGPGFREGSSIMPVVLAGVFLANIGTFAHKPFEIAGRTRMMVVAGFIAAGANLVLCLLLIPAIGYTGAAYATLLAYLLYTMMVGTLGRRIIPWRLNGRRILSYGAVIIGGVAGLSVLRQVLGIGYFIELSLAIVGAVALSAAVLLGVVQRTEGGDGQA